MNETETTTLDLILSAAMQEFLEKGFKSASLRNIVKKAGVTTGAFYGYYDSKEALFEALVGEQYDYFLRCFSGAQQEFAIFRKKSSRRISARFPAHVCTICFCTLMSIWTNSG